VRRRAKEVGGRAQRTQSGRPVPGTRTWAHEPGARFKGHDLRGAIPGARLQGRGPGDAVPGARSRGHDPEGTVLGHDPGRGGPGGTVLGACSPGARSGRAVLGARTWGSDSEGAARSGTALRRRALPAHSSGLHWGSARGMPCVAWRGVRFNRVVQSKLGVRMSDSGTGRPAATAVTECAWGTATRRASRPHAMASAGRCTLGRKLTGAVRGQAGGRALVVTRLLVASGRPWSADCGRPGGGWWLGGHQ
jgi:hypothetical protein